MWLDSLFEPKGKKKQDDQCEFSGICIYEGSDECDKAHPERCLIYLEYLDES